MHFKSIYIIVALATIFCSCNSTYTPKPRGYFAIPLPEKKYTTFTQAGYPYSFEYPTYAKVEKDSLFFGEKTENEWWINISFQQFDAKLHISYKELAKNNLNKLVEDAFKMAQKHSVKASAINEELVHTANNVHGVVFTVGGDVATENQFFLTDSSKHFLRGALYFNATPNADSILPIQKFLVTDVKHMINTLRWRN